MGSEMCIRDSFDCVYFSPQFEQQIWFNVYTGTSNILYLNWAEYAEITIDFLLWGQLTNFAIPDRGKYQENIKVTSGQLVII